MKLKSLLLLTGLFLVLSLSVVVAQGQPPVLDNSTASPIQSSAHVTEWLVWLRVPDADFVMVEREQQGVLEFLHAAREQGEIRRFTLVPDVHVIRVIGEARAVQPLAAHPLVREITRGGATEIATAREEMRRNAQAELEQSKVFETAKPDAVQPAAIAPQQTYTVTGIVRDWQGNPVDSASVTTQWPYPTYASDYTDVNGEFMLTGLAAGDYILLATKSGYADSDEVTVTVPPAQTGVVLTFPQSYTITGTVRDWQDNPVGSANVATASDDPIYASDYTDAEGNYTLIGLGAGTYHIIATQNGYADSDEVVATVPPNQSGVDLTFPQSYTITGTVRDWQGNPVESAQVATDYDDDPSYASDYTDAEGNYTLVGLGAGTYHIGATKSGYVSADVVMSTVPPSQSGVDLTFPQSYTVTGTVRDWQGNPVESARVSTDYNDPVYVTDYTDTEGRYTLIGLGAGSYHVKATHDEHPDAAPLDVTVPPNQTGVDFTFPRSYTVTGTVRDWQGNLVESAYVRTSYDDPVSKSAYSDVNGEYTLSGLAAGDYHLRASKEGYPDISNIAVSVPPDQSGIDLTFAQPYSVSGTVRDWQGNLLENAYVSVADGPSSDSDSTDANGQYLLDELAAGSYQISVYKSGHAPPSDRAITVPPNQTGVDFQFLRPYFVRGTVRDAVTNQPLEGVHIFGGLSSATTDASGNYTATVGAGDEDLYPSADGYDGGWRYEVWVHTPPDVSGVDFYLRPLNQTVAGAVFNSDGSPAVGKEVEAWELCSDWRNYYVTTNADGTYALDVPNDTIDLEVYTGKPEPKHKIVAPGTSDVIFNLPTAYHIHGRVTVEGAPVDDIEVNAMAVDKCSYYRHHSYVNTNADGYYTLTVDAGTYDVYAANYDWDWGAGKAALRLPQTATVGPDVHNLDITYPYVISGTVRRADGTPIQGANIDLDRLDASGWAYLDTTEDGTYTFAVVPGNYRLEVDIYDYADPSDREVMVVDSNLTNVDFDIPAYAVRGTVRDVAGAPLADAEVSTELLDNYDYTHVRTDATGVYTLYLAAGTHTFSVMKDGHASPPAQQVSVTGDMTGLDWQMVTPYTVTGVVRDAEGNPIPNAAVNIYDPNGNNVDWSPSFYDGSYYFVVGAGNYTVEAREDWTNYRPTLYSSWFNGYCGYTNGTRDITVSGNMTGIDFVLHEASNTVSGRVTYEDGSPACRARIRSDARVGYDQYTYTYDDGVEGIEPGTYFMPLPDGSWNIYPSVSGYSADPASRAVSLPPDAYDQNFVLRGASPTPTQTPTTGPSPTPTNTSLPTKTPTPTATPTPLPRIFVTEYPRVAATNEEVQIDWRVTGEGAPSGSTYLAWDTSSHAADNAYAYATSPQSHGVGDYTDRVTIPEITEVPPEGARLYFKAHAVVNSMELWSVERSMLIDPFEPNDTMTQTATISPETYYALIRHTEDVDWYKMNITTPHTGITITLSGVGHSTSPLPADYDVAVFGPTITSTDEVESTAMFGSAMFGSAMFGSAMFGSAMFGSAMFGSAMFGSAMFGSAMFGSAMFGSAMFGSAMFGSAVNPGIGMEQIHLNTRYNVGDYYIGVWGSDGAYAARTLYQLSVTTGAPNELQCQSAARDLPSTLTTPLPLPPVDSNIDTIILVNRPRLTQYYPEIDIAAFTDKLTIFATHSEVKGVILDVAADAAVQTAYDSWDANVCNPYLANDVAAAIKRLLLHTVGEHTKTLKYIVIIGSDELVPFFRVPDAGTVENEGTYGIESSAYITTATFAALEEADAYILTNDFYADVKPYGPPVWRHELLVPDYAIGRLVETPAEIMGMLDVYETIDGTLVPHNGLAFGYDFLLDGAQVVSDTFSTAGLAMSGEINDEWTAADLREMVNSRYDLNYVSAHFTHYAAQPARVEPTQPYNGYFINQDVLSATANFDGALVFSLGCHSGFNLPDENSNIDAKRVDFAQAFNRQGATYLANTGYGYGESEGVDYSERLMQYFVAELAGGTSAVGEALRQAKLRYYEGEDTFIVYDEKAMIEATLYGLPMYQVNITASAGMNLHAGDECGESVMTKDGLTAAEVTLNPQIVTNTVEGKGTYYTVDGEAQTTPYLPVQPRTSCRLAQRADNLLARGVFLEGATCRSIADFDPVIASLITDTAQVTETAYAIAAWYPTAMHNINRLRTETEGIRERLIIVPAQYRTVDIENYTGEERVYTALSYTVYYSNTADYVPPAIGEFTAVAMGERSGVRFRVRVTDDNSAVRRVAITYLTDNQWHTFDLSLAAGEEYWEGNLSNVGTEAEYFVQALDSAGNVATSSNKGFMFQARAEHIYLPVMMKNYTR